MRIAKEVRRSGVSTGYRHEAELVVSVCRQNEGWIRSVSPEAERCAGGQNPSGSPGWSVPRSSIVRLPR